MKSAYIIENNLRITGVMILDESYGTCLVKFPTGGGMRINSKRLFATKEEAEKVLKEKSQKEENGQKPVYKPEPMIKEKNYHSPHYYGWC